MRTPTVRDLAASLVVFLIALPLSMGIALASGVPPALGLITAVIGGLVVGTLGGAPLQISGPSAGLAVLVLQMVDEHGFVAFGVIVILAGGLQVLAGLLKLGSYFRAVSPAVIRGMLSGIGILIIASQFHVMIDDDIHGSGLKNLIRIPEGIVKAVTASGDRYHHLAALIGVSTLAAILLWERFKPGKLKIVPGPLVGAILAAALAGVLRLPIRYVAVPDDLLSLVRLPGAEAWASVQSPDILFAGLALAFVASAETLLCATAVSRMHDKGRTSYDRELAVHGLANALCGLVGTLPITGVISRSTANVEAGADTRWSASVHAVWIAAFVLLFPQFLGVVPTSSLAAILVYIGFKLVNWPALRTLRTYGKGVLGIAVATMASIVLIDLLKGIIIGLVLSGVRLMYALAHLEIERQDSDGRIEIHLHGSATFFALPSLGQELEDIPSDAEVHFFIEELQFIDHACLELLADFKKRHEANGGVAIIEWGALLERYQRGGAAAGERAAARESNGAEGEGAEGEHDQQSRTVA